MGKLGHRHISIDHKNTHSHHYLDSCTLRHYSLVTGMVLSLVEIIQLAMTDTWSLVTFTRLPDYFLVTNTLFVTITNTCHWAWQAAPLHSHYLPIWPSNTCLEVFVQGPSVLWPQQGTCARVCMPNVCQMCVEERNTTLSFLAAGVASLVYYCFTWCTTFQTALPKMSAHDDRQKGPILTISCTENYDSVSMFVYVYTCTCMYACVCLRHICLHICVCLCTCRWTCTCQYCVLLVCLSLYLCLWV